MDTIRIIVQDSTGVVIGQGYVLQEHSHWLGALVLAVVGAALFLILKLMIRPRIEISDKIVFRKRVYEGDILELFQFKFINRTLFPIEDTRVTVQLQGEYAAGDKKNILGKDLPLRDAFYDYLPGIFGKNRRVHDNCVLVGFKGNLKTEWNKNTQRIVIYVTSRHSITGFRTTKKRVLNDYRNCIVDRSMFKSGHTFETMPDDH